MSQANQALAPAASAPSVLPEAIARRGVSEAQWRTLANNLFPGAASESVLMVIDYCLARKLDPMKKPCHIVPMSVKNTKTGKYEWRDVVMPGIYEYRITAMRTGNYLGHSRPEFGPDIQIGGTTAPEWCEMTFYRRDGTARIEFPVRVYFSEAVGLKDGRPNERWNKAPRQMLTKCCEAAGLREAFPDEFGGEATAEELDGQRDIDAPRQVSTVAPARRLSATEAIDITSAADAPAVADLQVTEEAPQATNTASTRPHVGLVVEVLERPNGVLVVLSTGFRAASKDPELIKAATSLKGTDTVVELVTRPSSDPTKYAPTLEEIQPGEEA